MKQALFENIYYLKKKTEYFQNVNRIECLNSKYWVKFIKNEEPLCSGPLCPLCVCVWRSSAEEGSETYQYNSIQSFSPGAH